MFETMFEKRKLQKLQPVLERMVADGRVIARISDPGSQAIGGGEPEPGNQLWGGSRETKPIQMEHGGRAYQIRGDRNAFEGPHEEDRGQNGYLKWTEEEFSYEMNLTNDTVTLGSPTIRVYSGGKFLGIVWIMQPLRIVGELDANFIKKNIVPVARELTSWTQQLALTPDEKALAKPYVSVHDYQVIKDAKKRPILDSRTKNEVERNIQRDPVPEQDNSLGL
jgi:hypothetical protein